MGRVNRSRAGSVRLDGDSECISVRFRIPIYPAFSVKHESLGCHVMRYALQINVMPTIFIRVRVEKLELDASIYLYTVPLSITTTTARNVNYQPSYLASSANPSKLCTIRTAAY